MMQILNQLGGVQGRILEFICDYLTLTARRLCAYIQVEVASALWLNITDQSTTLYWSIGNSQMHVLIY